MAGTLPRFFRFQIEIEDPDRNMETAFAGRSRPAPAAPALPPVIRAPSSPRRKSAGWCRRPLRTTRAKSVSRSLRHQTARESAGVPLQFAVRARSTVWQGLAFYLLVTGPVGARFGRRWTLLKRAFAALFVADANRLFYPRQEYFTVADLSCLGGLQYGVHYCIHQLVRQHHLQLDLQQQVHRVLAPAVHLGVPLLASVPAHFGHRHSFNSHFAQRILHRFKP